MTATSHCILAMLVTLWDVLLWSMQAKMMLEKVAMKNLSRLGMPEVDLLAALLKQLTTELPRRLMK
jgi:hypothetical protein